MSVRLSQLHSQYAQRRETEKNRVEARESVNRYYDHWGKVTTRFDNWTNKDYYENADKKLQARKESLEKEKNLARRRAKLGALLAAEHDAYEAELKIKSRPMPRKINADNETLNRINENLREREQLKRKLEMEAKIYGRWRGGEQKPLLDAKSDNEVLAKLNWLDKQIEDQLQREKDEALAQERNLRLQEEISKTELVRKESQLIREQEIKEIRALQERHLEELKQRQQETEKLKEEEKHIRMFLEEITKERELLEDSTTVMLQRPDFGDAYNLRKIKVFLKNRLETYRKQVNICINILERIRTYAIKSEPIDALLQKYKDTMENESLGTQIECMYESEAKANLCRCEDTWRDDHLKRYEEIKNLFASETNTLEMLLEENIRQQKEIIELRTTHLTAIDNSNEKLKILYKEQENYENSMTGSRNDTESTVENLILPEGSKGDNLVKNTISDTSCAVPSVTNSFNNLNLDCWENLPPKRSGGGDTPRLDRTRSMNVVTAENVEPPKFGRKRVAWT